MKKMIKKGVKRLFSNLGYRIEKKAAQPIASQSKDYLLFHFFSIVKRFGFSPRHIVDVGANHGTWTRETLQYFPDAHYTLLEPQSWLQSSVQDLLDANPKVQFHAVGAGDSEGSFKFTLVDRDDSCSFQYTEEEARAKGFKQVDIPVVTLNNLIGKSNLPIPDIIKIDAEGLDIEVLNGASDFFGKTEIFMVEAGVVNKMYRNSFLEITRFMDQKGYRLFEITDMNRPFQPRVLWLIELVFVKKGGFIDSQVIGDDNQHQ